MPKLKRSSRVPRFESEAAEREFWETHDTADYLDWGEARPAVFANLKPSTETISLRLPAGLLAELRVLANKRDVPYQSLLKVFLAERLARERFAEPAAMPDGTVLEGHHRLVVLRERGIDIDVLPRGPRAGA